MVEHQTTKSRFWVTYRHPDAHGYPGGVRVVFSKDPGQLESRSVSVQDLELMPERLESLIWIKVEILGRIFEIGLYHFYDMKSI